MRNIYVGGQDFSPQAQVYRDTIEFWKRILKQKQVVMISRAALRALAEQVELLLTTLKRISEEIVKHKLATVYRVYF